MFALSSVLLPPTALAEPSHSPLTNIFSPESTPAKSIFDLSVFVLAITGIIFAVVFALLVYSISKFRANSTNAGREPAQVYGSTQIELAWTVIPILIVVVLFLATARVIHAIQDTPEPEAAVEVTAIGHHPNRMWMDPRRTGIFLGQCAQYCGTQHAKMLLRVSVDSPEDFAAWVRSQQLPAVQDPSVTTGRQLFEHTACINCHTVSGTPADGRFGPDLTHLMSRRTIAAGAAENTPDNLRLWIQDPNAIKPASLMPAMKLSDADVDAVVKYMETLR
jgi:cytochrome c oxidase subunit 2